MKTDIEIRKDIMEELDWDAKINGSAINVDLKEGHVVLSGTVDSYPKKIRAEEAVRRIMGVKSVGNDLKVIIPTSSKRADAEIRRAVIDSIKWNSSIQENKIKVDVEDGWVTLTGSVDWQYQRSKARLLAEDITGVVGVTNLITVVSTFASSQDVKNKINTALKRNYYLDTRKINVQVDNGRAILTGQVRTLAEKSAAETAAWSAPGITDVLNELVIDYSEVFA
jgi:osmotically-inducible protein OsmY